LSEASKWRLTWGELSFSEDDLTGAHLSLIGVALGGDTWDISPADGPRRLQAVLASFLAVNGGMRLDDACALLASAPAVALVDALSFDAPASDIDK